ncbi:G patch domain and ankyrin repeat-containing protein 1 homolog [Leguminivora glycinivorella]|uniref:G patch domain and ankyrin repeat-containing protein 1 homolog n=1 Tax=Leguminivora glycinivorella TaxID=1035111 RepID=UPI00200DF99E|nr:G patch domain and ankyrin repeat-containing protein 1 homolog [Leguminivora glycinivorella]
MSNKKYSNFVRPTSPTEELVISKKKFQINTSISGEEARTLYLEEVDKANNVQPSSSKDNAITSSRRRASKRKCDPISNKDLFIAVQNNDIDTTIEALDSSPDKINIMDDFGWSLLMIACQANSIDTVKELLKRGVDTTVRDKAGNSAQSLVIQNKNLTIADILISHKHKREKEMKIKVQSKTKVKLKEFHCSLCNQVYQDEQEHLSSTVHNINASRGKKIPTNYAIPQTNKGYQIMLKTGWDRDSGLGPEGTGKKYPIKAVQKKDRKGLGNVKKEEPKEDTVKHKTRKSLVREYESNKKMEINFRREFY